MESDWRLFKGQELYLQGATLILHSYEPSSASNDHDHCEFCMAKFGKNHLNRGYSTEDNGIWICQECYEEFRNQFEWSVMEES